MIASRIASETWSQSLSGWPSVTDSDVKRYCAASTMLVMMLLGGDVAREGITGPRARARSPVWAAPNGRSR